MDRTEVGKRHGAPIVMPNTDIASEEPSVPSRGFSVGRASGDAETTAQPYLRLAKHFENVSETYREVRLFGPANDAEAWKGVCEFLSRRHGQADDLAVPA
jgi:hypothetical protein